jgi:thiopeptide-type bacteriocin biosynthesis protein
MAIDILEQVFSINSDICSNIIAAQYTYRLTLDPLAIAIFSLDRFFATWNYNVEHRLQWLQKRTEKYAFSKEFHHERKQYCELLAPWDQHTDSNLSTQRNLLNSLIMPLEGQLTSLATQIHDLAQAGQLWVTEDDLLASLSHMHKVRLIDLDRSKEQKMYAFWRSTLESIRLRQMQKTQKM